MAKSLLESVLDSIMDDKWLGKRGEKLTERELKWVNLFGRKGMTLRNIYVPTENGNTSEIDLVYITQKGIFVFESKNYSGWVFGDEKAQYWTAMLPNREKNRFYNPIRQNRTHIKWLGNYIGTTIPLFSVIVFSERCELKKVQVSSSDVHVIKRQLTYATVRNIWEASPTVLTDEEVSAVYERLKPLTDADKAVKAAHIERIEQTYKAKQTDSRNTESDTETKVCPQCGKTLVLRTAKKGPNAGNRFWGCSGYPDCKYIENM